MYDACIVCTGVCQKEPKATSNSVNAKHGCLIMQHFTGRWQHQHQGTADSQRSTALSTHLATWERHCQARDVNFVCHSRT